MDALISQISVPHIVSVLLALYVGFIVSQLLPDKTKPPTVFHFVPLLGSAVVYGINPYKFWEESRRKYGDVFTFVMLGKKMTVALGSHGNELVLGGKLSYVSAEEAYGPLTTPVFGKGVVYDVPNATLMEHKKFMKFGLTGEFFQSYVPLIIKELQDYIKTSGVFRDPACTVDVSKAMPEITIFTASRSLQGEEVRKNLDAGFAGLFHDLDRGFSPMNFVAPWAPWPQNGPRDRAREKLSKSYMDIVQRRRASGASTTEQHDMIWNLMNQTYKDGTPVSDMEIAHMMIALLMAGQHTSSATSQWMLLHLAERPDLQQQLLDEQKAVLGADLPEPQYAQLKDLKLHNYVVRETLRMHPPLHSLMRKVIKPLKVEGTKYVIPEGHYVLAAPGMSARNPEYFTKPLEFNIMRWETQKEDTDDRVDYGYGTVSKGTSSPYLPFGAGRHRCIGEQFAYLQLATILCMIVRQYSLSLPSGKLPAEDYTSMVVMPVAPAYVKFTKRV